jgi:arsenate reductase (glutaredoxin)
MLKIYHNPRCSKSREGLKYLTDKQCRFEIIQYLDNPLTADELRLILIKLNMKPSEVVRSQEEIFRKELKGKKFTDEEWIHILVQNPKLIQRPIVEGRYKAVIAIPPETIDKLL